MPSETSAPWPECNCLALRQAARHVTQFYDQYLASTGLRTTQFSILAKLQRLGPMTINALSRELVMDRTTLGRTMLPLERDGLIAIKDGILDRRSKELAVTKAGTERLRMTINKVVTDDDLYAAADNAFKQGWTNVKMYFMVGQPTETHEDVEGIVALAKRVREIGRSYHGGRARVRVSTSNFIPCASMWVVVTPRWP